MPELSPRERVISHLPSEKPVVGNYSSDHFVIGGGVAIFHIASARVVVCRHKGVYFLPKGRRDVLESTEAGAEREGYEESGYRNRLLPLPIKHKQPQPRIPGDPRLSSLSVEPVWLQMVPQTPHSQYLLHWFVAETLPPALDSQLDAQEDDSETSIFGAPYQYPPRFPIDMTIAQRIALEPKGYEPVHHENTTNDEEEMQYESLLIPVVEAIEHLSKTTSIQADVVKLGWEGIQARVSMEK